MRESGDIFIQGLVARFLEMICWDQYHLGTDLYIMLPLLVCLRCCVNNHNRLWLFLVIFLAWIFG